MKFRKNEKTVVYFDGANLYSMAKLLNFDVDYRRVLKFFETETLLVRAIYYTALSEDQEYSSIRPLIDWLDYNGFKIVTKPTKEFVDSSGRRKVKGNMEIEIAVDVMEQMHNIDHVVLFSGDGDFKYLVEAVQRQGKRVTVVSTIQSHPPMAADDLRRSADQFIDIANHMDTFGRPSNDRGSRASHTEFDDDDDDEDYADD